MANLIVPAQSPLALALREPNLLVPGRKPVGDVVFDSLNQNINDFVVWNPLLASGRSIVGVQPTYGSSATLPITPTRYGLSSYLGESTNDYLAFSPTGGLSAPFTLLFTADFVSTAGSAARIISANSNRFEIAFYLSQIRGYFGSSWKAFSPALSQDLSFYSLAIVYDPAISRVTAHKYKNGVMTTHILDPGSVGSITTITLCNNTGGGAERAVSKVLDFRIYSSAKTEEEIYRIFKNYWRGLKPANDAPYLFSVGGGGATTLVVANASHGHAVDSPALTQQNTLAAADSTHAHAAEAPTLTVLYSLAPADASHAHAADNADLAQQSTLAVAESTHAHTAESPALTQAHLLAVSDSAHGHLVDNVVLVTAGALGVQDATHAHSAESPSLAQAATIAPQDAAHSHTADSPALVQASTVVVQDATHGHAADNLTLSLSTLLEVARSTHAHSADAVALTQAHLLAVADALHAHLAETPTLVQAGTLIVSDALHAHLADNVGLIEGELILPGGQRIYLVRADRRVHLVASERRLHLIN